MHAINLRLHNISGIAAMHNFSGKNNRFQASVLSDPNRSHQWASSLLHWDSEDHMENSGDTRGLSINNSPVHLTGELYSTKSLAWLAKERGAICLLLLLLPLRCCIHRPPRRARAGHRQRGTEEDSAVAPDGKNAVSVSTNFHVGKNSYSELTSLQG